MQLVGQIQEIVAEDLPVAMLYYTTMFFVSRTSVFDQWYYTPGGFGPGIPDVYNKHPYVTGTKLGTEVRQRSDS
jgi:peptide/nickel transport system substrate-binding protein